MFGAETVSYLTLIQFISTVLFFPTSIYSYRNIVQTRKFTAIQPYQIKVLRLSAEKNEGTSNFRELGQLKQKHILGLGVACVDVISCVDIYPKQDEKILATSTGSYSGGNVGNTLTAISLLNAASASVFTKIGDDSNGRFFLDDLRKVGVDVTSVVINPTAPTRLVYVIVDRQACRTCIASPNEQEMTVLEVNNAVYSTTATTDHISGLLEKVEVSYHQNYS